MKMKLELSLTEYENNILNNIVGYESLGLSKNIQQIFELFLTVLENNQTSDEKLNKLSNFIIEKRGKNTPAIKNVIDIIILNNSENNRIEVNKVYENIKKLQKKLILNKKNIIRHGTEYLHNKTNILLFDYSSSVTDIIKSYCKKKNKLNLIIPESRTINGGIPILKDLYELDVFINFIPDMAIKSFIEKTDVVLFGVESFDYNGDGWNTIGSYIVSKLANDNQVPVCIPTDTIKFNQYSKESTYNKKVIYDDFQNIYDIPIELTKISNLDFSCPEIEIIPNEFIQFYITEDGLITPENIKNYV